MRAARDQELLGSDVILVHRLLSANHSMHGRDAVIEEILDWRPYDKVTDLTILATPEGPVRLPRTIELEPVPGGTGIHIRYGAPRTRREQALAAPIAEAYGAALRAAVPGLVEELEARQEEREADRGPDSASQ